MRVTDIAAAAAFAALVPACATGDPRGRGKLYGAPQDDGWGSAPARRAPLEERKLDTRKVAVEDVASQFSSPIDCERGAQRLFASNPGAGWALLRACVYEKELYDLGPLTRAPWRDVVVARFEESAEMIAYMIARRGGNLSLDLEMCRQFSLPIVSLEDALADPSKHRQAVVVMRGQIVDGRPAGAGLALEVAETKLRADNFERGRYSEEAHAALRRAGGSRNVSRERARGRSKKVVVHTDTVATPTGRTVIAKMDHVDPEMKLDKEYVFLVRFQGIEPARGDDVDAEDLGLVSVLAYFEPGPPLIF